VQALPGKLKNNVQLVEILLENNKLTSVPPVVMEMPWIKDLRMTSNRLTTYSLLLLSLPLF
jgi:Leucine-rich repeat (LRR) protein